MSNNIKIFGLISVAFAMMIGSFAALNYLLAQPNEKNNKLAETNIFGIVKLRATSVES